MPPDLHLKPLSEQPTITMLLPTSFKEFRRRDKESKKSVRESEEKLRSNKHKLMKSREREMNTTE